MSDRLRRRRSSRAPFPIARIVIAAAVLTSLIVGGTFLYVLSGFTPTNKQSLCPVDRRKLSEVLVLLLDRSDRLSLAQRLKVKNEIKTLKATVSRFGLVEVYEVDRSNTQRPEALLSICNPGTGDDLNELYENPELAKRQWETFSNRLDEQVDRVIDSDSSPTSPIFEAIQATALRTFGALPTELARRRLVIVSDLVQHVPGCLSQFGPDGAASAIVPFADFRHTNCYNKVRTNDLTGVAVTLLYLVRTPPQKWPDHRVFWEEYLQSQGATVELLEPVYGGQDSKGGSTSQLETNPTRAADGRGGR
jgi:hypothetical protein